MKIEIRLSDPVCTSKSKTCKVSIKEVVINEVTPMFKVSDYDHETRLVVEYAGKLYRPEQKIVPERNSVDIPLHQNQKASEYNWQYHFGYEYYGNVPSTLVQQSEIKKRASCMLIVDGILYRRCGEPYYDVITFGLGGNYGGTSMFINWAIDRHKQRGWSATDKDRAKKGCCAIALRRGDTNDVDRIKECQYENIEVLRHDAVKLMYEFPDAKQAKLFGISK